MKDDVSRGALSWLAVAITAMAFMGAYAFLIVLSRAPVIGQLFATPDFFKTGLVTHVVLAVVIWFLAFVIFITHYVTKSEPVMGYELAAPAGALLGVLMIVATPFTGPAHPTLNNYVPVLARPLYYAGVTLFFISAIAGAIMRAGAVYSSAFKKNETPAPAAMALLTATFALVVGAACFAVAWFQLSGQGFVKGDVSRIFFESLFWGGGHVLQFANTAGLMAVWALLAREFSGSDIVETKVAGAVFSIMAAFIIAAPFYYMVEPVFSPENRSFYTLLKGWGLSFGPVVFGVALAAKWGGMGARSPEHLGLYASLALFTLGGLIALTIEGSDTRIPAHYHGSIGAVTLGFMTMGLFVMSRNGRLTVRAKWRSIQLGLYAVGQSLFVTGLFIGGTRGLQRKTFGVEQKLDDAVKFFGMTVMGIGGLMAIISGAIFVVFMIKALAKKPETGSPTA